MGISHLENKGFVYHSRNDLLGLDTDGEIASRWAQHWHGGPGSLLVGLQDGEPLPRSDIQVRTQPFACESMDAAIRQHNISVQNWGLTQSLSFEDVDPSISTDWASCFAILNTTAKYKKLAEQ